MDESQIKALYRHHTQMQTLTDQSGDDIAAALSQHSWPVEETTALDRVAASATASDIARIVAALGPDIEALTKDIRQTRSPRHTPLQRFVRRGFALAAGIGAFAVLFSLLPGPQQTPGATEQPLHDPANVIMAMSFEGTETIAAGEHASRTGESIFRGNFDS
ncbi:hypothetical protein OS187_05865 [Xanthomonadaceae bacterium JHOS43]|nr:hypothetical protein [Xanthomonadaceae bacterium JHOS43]MCX7562482.1 hypothetical protein [Xanthomonadaceae bacterium XH05]